MEINRFKRDLYLRHSLIPKFNLTNVNGTIDTLELILRMNREIKNINY